MSIDARIARIQAKLASVRTQGLRCFGAGRHRFVLAPPAAGSSVAAFEAQHGIVLPPDYRAFLTTAGNGGAGPYYGLYAFDEWDDLALSVFDDVPDDWLARPCPLAPGSHTLDPDDIFDVMPNPFQGTMTIGTQGCGFMIQYIVTGPSRGRVMYADIDAGPAYVTRTPDFLAWYERWLDELLGGVLTDWFGYGPGGDESSLIALLDDAGTPEDLRLEAVKNLYRLPSLSDRSRDRIPPLLRANSAEFRDMALRLMRRFRIEGFEPEAAALLDDPSRLVRIAALQLLARADAVRWRDELDALILDPDAEVSMAAFFALKNSGALDADAKRNIAATAPHPAVKRQAAYSLAMEARARGDGDDG